MDERLNFAAQRQSDGGDVVRQFRSDERWLRRVASDSIFHYLMRIVSKEVERR